MDEYEQIGSTGRNLMGHSVYLNTEHYFVSFGHFLAKNGQKVMS